MDIFIEKGFIENFEIEYDPQKSSRIQEMIFKIFSEYTGINLFIDIQENEFKNFYEGSELLSNLFNYNPNYTVINNFEKYFRANKTSYQTLVFTEKNQTWFSSLKERAILCFSWDNYEAEIEKFIKSTHFKVDLSDNNYSFNWKDFSFIGTNTTFIVLSDSYILADKSGQKIKDNVAKLFGLNLNLNSEYKIFIITDLNGENGKKESVEIINSKIKQINSALAKYKSKIYVFNRLKTIEKTIAHDRLLYTNYTICEVGIGFNLSASKKTNSAIINESIFEKFTYQRHQNHIAFLKNYISKLENWEDYNNPYKTNSLNSYKEFERFIV